MTLQQLIEDLDPMGNAYDVGYDKKFCLSVVVDDPFQFGMELGHAIAEHNVNLEMDSPNLIKLPEFHSIDSTGCGTIIYFPNIKYVEPTEHPMTGAL